MVELTVLKRVGSSVVLTVGRMGERMVFEKAASWEQLWDGGKAEMTAVRKAESMVSWKAGRMAELSVEW